MNVKDLKAYYHSGPEDDEASHLVKERISVGVLMHHKQKRPPRCGVTSAQTQAASEQGGQLSITCQENTLINHIKDRSLGPLWGPTSSLGPFGPPLG